MSNTKHNLGGQVINDKDDENIILAYVKHLLKKAIITTLNLSKMKHSPNKQNFLNVWLLKDNDKSPPLNGEFRITLV